MCIALVSSVSLIHTNHYGIISQIKKNKKNHYGIESISYFGWDWLVSDVFTLLIIPYSLKNVWLHTLLSI